MGEPSLSPNATGSILASVAPDSDAPVFLFTFDRAQYLLCSFSFALAVFVSAIVYLNGLSCYIPPDAQSPYLSYPADFVNTQCGLQLLNVTVQAYALWLQSLALLLPLSVFYLAHANTVRSVLRLVAASYASNIDHVRQLSGDDVRKAFAFAFLRAQWPWAGELLPNEDEPLDRASSTIEHSLQTRLLTASRDKHNSTLPYSLEKELSYSQLNTSLRQDPSGDKAAFTYLLDHVCYPQSYQWVRSRRTWAWWYISSSVLSTVVGGACLTVWMASLRAASLTIDRGDFWCGDIPLFRSPSSSTATYLSAADGTRLTLSCHFASQQTLLGVWWLNLVLLTAFCCLLLWRLRVLQKEMKTDRDLLYLAMRDAFPERLLPNISQARGFLRNQVRLAGEVVPATSDPIHWVPAIRAAWVGLHERYYASLKRREQEHEHLRAGGEDNLPEEEDGGEHKSSDQHATTALYPPLPRH